MPVGKVTHRIVPQKLTKHETVGKSEKKPVPKT